MKLPRWLRGPGARTAILGDRPRHTGGGIVSPAEQKAREAVDNAYTMTQPWLREKDLAREALNARLKTASTEAERSELRGLIQLNSTERESLRQWMGILSDHGMPKGWSSDA